VCKDETHTLEMGIWESSETPKISEFNCKGQNTHILKSSLYHWKAIEVYMSKMGSHEPFGHLQHKLWPKERPGVKLPV
jgi:hypothetical protein